MAYLHAEPVRGFALGLIMFEAGLPLRRMSVARSFEAGLAIGCRVRRSAASRMSSSKTPVVTERMLGPSMLGPLLIVSFGQVLEFVL